MSDVDMSVIDIFMKCSRCIDETDRHQDDSLHHIGERVFNEHPYTTRKSGQTVAHSPYSIE